MDREILSEALGGIADRHIDAALREGEFAMQKQFRLRRIAVLAAAAALLLALGATAWAALDGAAWFKSWFGADDGAELTEGQIRYIDQTAAGIGQSVTAGGWTVTLDSAMTDGEHVFMGLTARPETGEEEMCNTTLSGRLTSADPDAPEDYFYGAGMSSFDQRDGALYQLMELSVNDKYLGQPIDFSYPLTLTVDCLENGPDGEETQIQGPWVFDFTLTLGGSGGVEVVDQPFTAVARFVREYLNGAPFDSSTLKPGTVLDGDNGLELRYEAVDVTVTSLKLDPMGAVCTYVYEGGAPQGSDPKCAPDIGTVQIELAGGSGRAEIASAAGGWVEEQQAYVTCFAFHAPIDLDEVTAVTLQGHALQMPAK